VQVDVVTPGELDSRSRWIAGALELGGPPRLDQFLFCLADVRLGGRHLDDLLRFTYYFG
jgi:hypothetical protein